MLKKCLSGLLCAAALTMATSASAEVATFEFCGHMTFSNALAREGTPVTGQFFWDTATPGSPLYPGAPATYYGPLPNRFELTVGRQLISAESMNVVVWNDTGSNFADFIDIGGLYPITIDGTVFPRAYFGIRLATSYSNTTVFQDTSLPLDLDVTKFDSQSFQLFSGVSSNDVILDVKFDWIRRTSDPQPGQSERKLCHQKPQGPQ